MTLHGTPLELPPCFGRVALPHQAPLALRVLMLCFVPVLTLDLLPIPFKRFLLQRTLCFLAWSSTLSPRNFALILLVSPKSSISLTPGPLNNIVLNANYSFPYCKLNFIYTVCRPGRTFLRRMLDVLCRAHHPAHHLRLNRVFHKDLLWWRIFLSSWNGRSFLYDDK